MAAARPGHRPVLAAAGADRRLAPRRSTDHPAGGRRHHPRPGLRLHARRHAHDGQRLAAGRRRAGRHRAAAVRSAGARHAAVAAVRGGRRGVAGSASAAGAGGHPSGIAPARLRAGRAALGRRGRLACSSSRCRNCR
ncbi:MAG: hypothetical protein MZW92_80150 [Comamonadaceae bacterium]|nr:hypothetical protein [Comamonadaceae bacterium]